METRTIFKNVWVSLISCLIVVMVSCISVFAEREEVDSVTFVGKGQTLISSICKQANNYVGVDVLTYTGNDGLISFSNKKYKTLDIEDRRAFMETSLSLVKESGLGNQVKNKVYNFIADQDTTTSAAVKYLRSDASADFAEAAAYFKPFGSAFGVFMGVISLLIFMFLGSGILVDLAYIAIPMFRLSQDNKYDSTKPKHISIEAYSAVHESENSVNGDYKGAVGIYLKRRIPVMFLIAICLSYLISGQIYSIIGYIMDAFSWVFEMSFGG